MDQQPFGSNGQPNDNNQQPYANQPSFGNQQPFGDNQPSFGSQQPFSDNQQGFGNQPQQTNQQQPYGYDQSRFGYDQQQQFYGNQPPQYPPVPQQRQSRTVMAAIALVCGILALTLPVPVLDVIFGIAGIVLAGMAMNSRSKGLAIAGLVVSILGTLVAIAYTMDELGLLEGLEYMSMMVTRF